MKNIEKLLAAATIFWTLGISSIIAQPRSLQELDAIANSVFSIGGARSANRMVMSMASSQVLKSVPAEQNDAFYVYTPSIGGNNSFVIVSSDKRMPAVLGYSSESSFDADNLPEGLQWFLEKCQADLELLNEPTVNMGVTTRSNSVVVNPLLGNRVWDQGKPFNNQCPEVSSGVHSVTGCTATAMAQIMAYHKHPYKGRGNINYFTSTNSYAVNADMYNAPAYDWNNMIDSYNGTYNDEQANAVAQLMFHVGAAITMDYGVASSGAEVNSPEKAFITNFGYDDGIRIVRRNDCSNEVWFNLLEQELTAKRPVLVSGFDSNGHSGHTFVFDGLDAEGNFHVNWGWGGLCNGYYNLYGLAPEETGIGGGLGDYNYNCQALIGIHPEDGIADNDPTNIVVGNVSSANGIGIFDLKSSISLNLRNIVNMRYFSFEGDAQLMLTDAGGNDIVTMLGSPLNINSSNKLQSNYIENFSLTTSLPDDIANGDYRLYIGVRQSGYEQWGRARAQIADIPYHYDYYELTVADGKYILGRINTDNDKEEDYEGIPKTVEQISSRKVYTIHNNLGTLGIQNGRLVLNSQEANQFVFYKHNGRFYLYNLEKQSLIGLDDNVEERERYALVNSTPSAVMLRRGLDDNYPFAIKIDNLWLNTNLEYEIVANSQNWLSVGNQFRLVPTETMTEMQEYRMLQKIKTVQENSTIFTNILPFGTEQAWKSKYRFSESLDNYEEPVLDANGRNWKDLDYDDSAWPTLTGPMAGGYYYPVINHDWNGVNNAYELRRKFRLDEKPRGLFTFSVIHDFDIKIYLNGNLVAEKQIDSGSSFDEYLIPADWFLQGDNILAIYIRKCNKSFLDYSLYNERLPEIYTDKQGVKYQLAVDGGSTASVIGHSKTYRNAIIIPNEIMGYSVTGIASKAFADVNDLTTVTMLSENPYVIPEDAFSETIFQNTQLIVPYSCYSVYQKTSGWNKFKNITYIAPDEYTDEQGVVYALKNGDTYYVKGFTDKLISKVVLPETLLGKPVTMIGDKAFEKSSQLEEIVISNSVTTIGFDAFYRCTGLTSVTIPNSVTSIGGWAFGGCLKLKKIHIGCGVEKIAGELFYETPSLESITVDENNKYFSSYKGFLYDKYQTTLYAVPSTVSSFMESDFPSTLTRIDGSLSNVDVDDVVIPATVSIIDGLSFKRCKSLTLLSHACQISGNFCRFIENLYLHAYYPPQFLGEAVFGSQVNENCVIHVPVGLKTSYQETISKSGKSLTVIDDIELPSSIDVDYSLGYNYYIEPVGHMTKQITCSKLGTGFLLTKEQIKAYKGCRIVSFQAHISNSDDNELCAVITDGAGGKVLNQSKVFIGYFSGWKKILFDQPYTITGEEDELFIGITSTNEIRLSYTETIVPENALWFDWGGLERTNWQPWTGMGLALSYTVESDNLPANIRMMDVSLTADEKGNNHIKGKVENCTIGLVDGFDIAYSIDDGEIMTLHIDMPMVAKRLYEFEVEIPAEVPPGEHQMNVWVSKVGNRPDGIDSDSRASFILIGQNERYARKVVVEEGTGSWCGFCPRGIVAMHTMMQNHPDNFIPIAIHSGDNMVSPSYNQIFGLLGGTFPSYTMNRKYFGSPNTVDLETYYQQEVGKAVACIKMNAQWTDVDKNVVKIKTTSRFAYDMTDEFRIAYVVTESGVGPYPQANYYCNSKEEMGGFEKEGEVVPIVHNHVARSISSLNGESGPAQPKGMTDYEYSYMLTLPDNIDNKENIQLIVLLINQETGEIVNADNVDVSDVKEYNFGDFTYTLTYMVDGETYATEEIEYGETIVLKDAPKKEGYLFSGWSKVPATMPAHDVTVTGTFTVDGIEEIVTERLVDVYTLQGIILKRQISVDELKHELSRGIYIINGKKVVIR